ncbi:MAG: hypothetical protein ACI35W_00820 [Anaeroplasmataceae bacterium]
MSDYILELNSITKVKNKNIILDDINISIKPGHMIGIINDSNHYADELLRIILKLSKPSRGKMLFMNHDLLKEYSKCINHIGYMTDLKYKRNSTILEYILLTNSFYKADYTDRITYYIDLFRLDPNKKLDNLDIYERKIVSLINAIFFTPKLLLIDNLDIALSTAYYPIITMVLNDLKNNGTAILYTATSLKLSELADELILLKEAKIYSNILNNNLKYVNITGTLSENKELDNPNISNLKISSNNISFIYNGNINNLYKILSVVNILNLTIESPNITSLEELYEQEVNS